MAPDPSPEPTDPPPPTPKPGRPSLPSSARRSPRPIRTTPAEWATYHRAARLSDLSLSAWLRSLANRAARRIIKRHEAQQPPDSNHHDQGAQHQSTPAGPRSSQARH